MSYFELTMPGKVVFGAGCVGQVGAEAKAFGGPILLVHGSDPARSQKARKSLEDAGVAYTPFGVRGEPTVGLVREGAALARQASCRAVLCIGGGSVMDAGKAIAAMAANPGDLMDYLEVIGKGQPLTQAPLSVIAVPTTAGTGTEATRNAVLASPEHKVKVSLRHPSLIPKTVLLDPGLVVSVPPDITASTGMDALCQLIEPFACRTPNPFVDVLCREGLARAARSLLRSYRDGADLSARGDMVIASHFSGLALANAKLGAVHGFAAPLGGIYEAPHGALCAALLPAVIMMNLKALRQRVQTHPAVKRYEEVAQVLKGDKAAKAEDAAAVVDGWRKEMRIPSLKDLGVRREDFGVICGKASKASSMKGNPVELTMEELGMVLESAY